MATHISPQRYSLLAAVLWTASVGLSLAWNLVNQRNSVLEFARVEAQTDIRKNLAFRLWADSFSGVYVPHEEKSPTNSYTEPTAGVDVLTTDGKRLTLVNSSFLLHQFMQNFTALGVRGHITSLKVLNPANAPDSWEFQALQSFNAGATEAEAEAIIEGKRYLRMMLPMTMEQRCLICHAETGVKVGGLRGGISVAVPLDRFEVASTSMEQAIEFSHGVAWLLGVVVIIFIASSMRRREDERKLAEDALRRSRDELEDKVIERTAELQAANRLKDELLVREHAASTELAQAREQEIEIGYRIQQTLLLDQPPRNISGLSVSALTIPSQRIDGDFYIFFKHPDQSLDVIVGDVMGKGVPAALLGAATKSHFLEALSQLTALSKDGELPQPREIVTLAHAEVARHLINLESFVTLCYVRLDLDRRSVVLVDCGHTGLIHMHRKTGLCELVHGSNLPLGVSEGEIYDQIHLPFEPGDVFIVFSDGVTEARNSADELFGIDRLKECVLINRDLEPDALVEAIRNAAFAFSGSDRLTDDLTCVAMKIIERQASLARAEMELSSDLKELGRARQFLRDFCRGLPGTPLDEENIAILELAATEACSNIMKHAYHGRTDQVIHFEAEAFSGSVSIRLHHLGDSFDPSRVPLPALDGSQTSGFGLFLINQSVDEVKYYYDERGRNCIALLKYCKPLNKGDTDGNRC